MNRREMLALSGALPYSPALVGQPVPAEPSDVGNLFPTLDWVSRQNKRQLSFLAPDWKSLADWKTAARPAFLQLLSYRPAVAPMTSDVLKRETRDGFSLETVRLRVAPAYDIPLRLLIPEKANWPDSCRARHSLPWRQVCLGSRKSPQPSR